MQGDGWLFVGILIFIFVLWLATGGPDRPISWSGPYVTRLTGPGDEAEGYGNEEAFFSNWGGIRTGVTGAGGSVTNLRESIAAAKFGNASGYKDFVSIDHSVGGIDERDPDEEYISISVANNIDEGITVSGWRIEDPSTGKSLVIPNGTLVPRSGTVNQTAPITLLPGDEAIIVIGTSPIGVSFKENLCTGYFDEYQSFTPELDLACPSPEAEYEDFYVGYDNSCTDYVEELHSCSAARPSSRVSNECRAFANQYLNYNGCVATHASEDDFYGDTWRIFLGSKSQFFTRDHGSVRLIDSTGKTVDLLSY